MTSFRFAMFVVLFTVIKYAYSQKKKLFFAETIEIKLRKKLEKKKWKKQIDVKDYMEKLMFN